MVMAELTNGTDALNREKQIEVWDRMLQHWNFRVDVTASLFISPGNSPLGAQ